MSLNGGGEEVRNKYLYDIFTQVNKIVLKKEKKKRKLLREAKRLQKEADDKVALLRDIEKIEEEYELQIRLKVKEL